MLVSNLSVSAVSTKQSFGWWGNYYTNQAYPGDYEGPRSYRNYVPRRTIDTERTVARYHELKNLAEKGYYQLAAHLFEIYFGENA